MNSYQSSAVTTNHLGSFGDDHVQNYQGQNYQDQNTMSWPTTSSPPTAFSFDAANLEPGPIQSTPQQSSATSEDRLSSANFQCGYCSQAFSRQYELTKHERIHTRPLQCHLCPEGSRGAAQKKDLDRHFWVYHQLYAQMNNIPKDSGVCYDCSYEGRSDNVKRHQQRAKHGEYRGRT